MWKARSPAGSPFSDSRSSTPARVCVRPTIPTSLPCLSFSMALARSFSMALARSAEWAVFRHRSTSAAPVVSFKQLKDVIMRLLAPIVPRLKVPASWMATRQQQAGSACDGLLHRDGDDLRHDRRVVRDVAPVAEHELQGVLARRQRHRGFGLATAVVDVLASAAIAPSALPATAWCR